MEKIVANEIARSAVLLQESIVQSGTKNHKGEFLLDEESSRAVSDLLRFLAKKVSIYSTDHAIEIKQAHHVF